MLVFKLVVKGCMVLFKWFVLKLKFILFRMWMLNFFCFVLDILVFKIVVFGFMFLFVIFLWIVIILLCIFLNMELSIDMVIFGLYWLSNVLYLFFL